MAVATDCIPIDLMQMGTPSSKPKRPEEGLMVLDFSSLWAGPLCGHLLATMGARVIKVESTRRPDGARSGGDGFFDRLHAGQEMLALDFTDPSAIAVLRSLMARADVVIEASRPRAFEQLGLAPEVVFRENPGLTWVSITAYGRYGDGRDLVGFGDDVGAAAGLLGRDAAGDPVFLGDAIADPVTGLVATVGAVAVLAAGGGHLVDVAMTRAAAFVAGAPTASAGERAGLYLERGRWMVADGRRAEPVRPPEARPSVGTAAPLGAHTASLLAEFP
jgi:crotonobetainyl-CoA:carnitine CoA-transferase CaiB-like acyl-CoA transferase